MVCSKHTIYYIRAALLLLLVPITGCSLPNSGPGHRAIDSGATEALLQPEDCRQSPRASNKDSYRSVKGTDGRWVCGYRRTAGSKYVLVNITPTVVKEVAHIGLGSFYPTFAMGKGAPFGLRIGVGDVISITVFESSSGGLFSGVDGDNRPRNFVTLPPQTVDGRGFISVPYVGNIRAAGSTPRLLQRRIEGKLKARAIEPQVIVSLPSQTSHDVAIFGDAAGNRKLTLKPGGRILDIIAEAGLTAPAHEVFITLLRSGQRATIFLPTLIATESENIYLRPGDTIHALRKKQAFIAIGALGNITQTEGITGRFEFPAARVSLAEGIAMAGGLFDTRADAQQVFLYRLEERQVLERLGMKLAHFDAKQKYIPTIYRANYRDPAAFFISNRFPIRHKDILYVANADSIEFQKFADFILSVTGLAAGVTSDIVGTRDAVRALGN